MALGIFVYMNKGVARQAESKNLERGHETDEGAALRETYIYKKNGWYCLFASGTCCEES